MLKRRSRRTELRWSGSLAIVRSVYLIGLESSTGYRASITSKDVRRRIDFVLATQKTGADHWRYLSIRWFGLNHKLVKTPVDCLKSRTVAWIRLPAADHYLIVIIMTVVGLDEFNTIIIQPSHTVTPYLWHSISTNYGLQGFIVGHTRIGIRPVGDQFVK